MRSDEPNTLDPRPVRAHLLDWGSALAGLLTLYAVAYLAWRASEMGSLTLRAIVARLAFVPLNATIVTLAWRAARRATGDPQAQRALWILGSAFAAVFAGNAAAFWWGVVRDGDPLVAWTNIPFFAFYILGVLAFFSLPLSRRVQGEWWKFLLDAATVMAGGGVALWFLVVRPSATGELDTVAGAITIAYPLGALLLLLGLTTALLRHPADRRRRLPAALVAGFAVYIVSDLANDLLILKIRYLGIGWTDFSYLLAYVLLAWGLHAYDARLPRRRATRQAVEDPATHPYSPLPLLAACTAYALLLWIGIGGWPTPIGVLAVGATSVTGLLALRQFAAVRENARLVTEMATRQSEARFRSLVQHSSDVIAILGDDGALKFVSPSVTRVFGYAPQELEGTKLTEVMHPDDASSGLPAFLEAARSLGVSPPFEWRVRHRDGAWLHVEAIGTNLLGEPTIGGIVLNTRDISERKALEAQLIHQAFHDPLTGLANRALFLDRVGHALTLLRRHGQMLAVLFVDLDHFKAVNDSLGHAAGDGMLITVAQRLLTCVRASDTVARLGGDEFAVLIEDGSDDASATAVVERIIESIQRPMQIAGKEVVTSASVGIAAATESASPADLLRNADMAMYMAKSRGKGRWEVFEPRMHREALERLEMEADLRHAIERGEFVIHYQPIVRLDSGAIVGVEALVRWQHPTRGTVTPAQFIPLAEETGLIVTIGAWVIREACHRAAEWQRRRTGDTPLTLTVNISGHQLQHERVVDDVREALASSGLDPRHLVLEITESVLMHHSATTLQRLNALKEVGVRLAIDDFGTGYSSLGYLQRFPIDILKIDKTFVDDVGGDGGEPALARAIMALGETLRLQTIAEGIEQKAQLSGLQELGCEMGQGFFFARPIPEEELERVLLEGGFRVNGHKRVVEGRGA